MSLELKLYRSFYFNILLALVYWVFLWACFHRKSCHLLHSGYPRQPCLAGIKMLALQRGALTIFIYGCEYLLALLVLLQSWKLITPVSFSASCRCIFWFLKKKPTQNKGSFLCSSAPSKLLCLSVPFGYMSSWLSSFL